MQVSKSVRQYCPWFWSRTKNCLEFVWFWPWERPLRWRSQELSNHLWLDMWRSLTVLCTAKQFFELCQSELTVVDGHSKRHIYSVSNKEISLTRTKAKDAKALPGSRKIQSMMTNSKGSICQRRLSFFLWFYFRPCKPITVEIGWNKFNLFIWKVIIRCSTWVSESCLSENSKIEGSNFLMVK